MKLQTFRRAVLGSGAVWTAYAAVSALRGDADWPDDRSLAQACQDTVVLWSEKSVQVGQAAASLVGTLTDTYHAWSRGDKSASENWRRSVVTRVEEWSRSDIKARTLVVLGGEFLLDWLLNKACSSESSDQRTAESAIYHLLSDDSTAAALLRVEGAVPRLLRILGQSGDADALAAQLHRAADFVSLPMNATLDDIHDTIAMVKGQDGGLVRRAAVRFLLGWAEASVVNCGKIAGMQGGPALARVLTEAGLSSQDLALAGDVATCMSVLARDSPSRMALGMERWLQQLLFLAADASAVGDSSLVVRALDAYSTCLLHTQHLQEAVEGANAWALLDSLAFTVDPNIRRAIGLAIAAMGRHAAIPEAHLEQWKALLLAWLCVERGRGDAERASIAAALQSMASTPGASGLGVAAAWLGEMVVTLSRDVKTYSSVRMGGRDMVEEVTSDHVPVVPAFARSVAHDLRGAYRGLPAWTEPPIDMEQAVRPTPLDSDQPGLLSAAEAVLADRQLCRALQTLCALVSSDDSKQRWLESAGVVNLLQRLTLDSNMDLKEDDLQDVEEMGGSLMSLETSRECARLLAMMAASGCPRGMAQNQAWIRWLKRSSVSKDCSLSSHASRALIHLKSGMAFQMPVTQETDLEQLGEHLGAGKDATAEQKSSQQGKIRERLVYRDGVHLLDPTSRHHTVLAQQGSGDVAEGSPEVDIVFVHGIRGGPFASWRTGTCPDGNRAESCVRDYCWPWLWLAPAVPQARLLSLEYAAPASGWEGESLPLRGTVGQLMDKLTAAGVGQRPTIYVCHSMGGILTKEMLAKASSPDSADHHRSLAATAAGLVFYACPHNGTWLADIGWTLRFVGASPAASVLHLRAGPHLEEVNDVIRQMHEEGRAEVLSFGEGAPTFLTMLLPYLVVVDDVSAYPGYGRFVRLEGVDHINACKPMSVEDASFAETLALVNVVMEKAAERHVYEESGNGGSVRQSLDSTS